MQANQPQARPAPAGPRVQYQEDYFVYTASFLALAPNGTAQQAIQVQADSDFKWVMSSYEADIAAAAFEQATAPVPNVTLQIVDTGSGRQLFSNPIPIPSVFGTGQLPFVLPIPRIFKARSSIQLIAANFDAAVTYNIRLSLIGTKIFQMG